MFGEIFYFRDWSTLELKALNGTPVTNPVPATSNTVPQSCPQN
jgi:hypothetical protein